MDNYFEYIQDYLDGHLSPEELQRFESELARNAELQAEADHQRALRDTIAKQLRAAEGLPALKATLQSVSGAHFGKPAKPKLFAMVRWLIPAAAAACLLIIFNTLGWFEVNYETLPDMPASVTRGVESEAIAKHAAAAFNAKNYDESISLLRPLVAEDTTHMRNRYFLGLSYLGLKDYRQSAATLRPIANGASVYADDAGYFLAVSLWRLGEPDESLRYAERVTNQSNYYAKARKLADKLAD